MRWLKRILKLAGILTGTVLLLLLLLAGIIRIPAVQQSLAGKAMLFLESKTGGEFSVGSIYLVWPLSVKIENLLVKEPDKDTLFYAGLFRTSVSLPALIKGKISIGDTRLEDAAVFLKRNNRDSIFNFEFIVDAFSDTLEKDTSKSSKEVEFSELHLKNIRFLLDDEVSGNYTFADIGEFDADAKSVDLENLNFSFDNISLKNSSAKILMRGIESISDTVSAGIDSAVKIPVIDADEILLDQVKLVYGMAADSSSLSGIVGNFKLKDAHINANIPEYTCDKIDLSNSFLSLYSGSLIEKKDTVNKSDSIQLPVFPSVTAKSIRLVNNFINTGTALKKIRSRVFDPASINLSGINLNVSDLSLQGNTARATIESASFYDSTFFQLLKLKTDVLFDYNKLALKQLELVTGRSSVDADIALDYKSLNEMISNPGKTLVDLDIQISRAGAEDISYWVPGYKTDPAIEKAGITLAMDIDGAVENISINRLHLTTEGNTLLNVRGNVKGLPDIKKLSYNIPLLELSTTSSEIRSFIPRKSWPESIEVPRFVKLKSRIKGTPDKAEADLDLLTDAGKIDGSVRMIFTGDTAYNVALNAPALKVNRILGDSAGLGETGFRFKVNGHGFDPDRLYASAEIDLDHVEYKNYRYHNARLAAEYLAKEITLYAEADDSALAFNVKAAGNIRKEEEYLRLEAKIEGADLKQMNMSDEDLRISALISTDLKGTNADNLNGTAGITKLIIAKNKNTYVLDSLLFASVNEEGKNTMKFSSSVLNLDLDGNVKPGEIADAVKHHINHYYPVFPPAPEGSPQHFKLEIDIQSHPVLSEVFFKGLTDFHPAHLKVEFDNAADKLECNAEVPRVEYNSQRIENFNLAVNTNRERMQYALSVDEAATGNYGVQNLIAEGEVAQNKGQLHLHEGHEKKDKDTLSSTLDLKVNFNGEEKDVHKLALVSPARLGTLTWTLPEDNSITIQNGETVFRNFQLNSGEQQLDIETIEKGLAITATNFDLTALSGVISRDTFPVTGIMNGEVIIGDKPGSFEAAGAIVSLKVMAVPVGDLLMDARQQNSDAIHLNVTLGGNSNDVRVYGTFTPRDSLTDLAVKGEINSLNAEILDGLSFGALNSTSGQITGGFTATGTSDVPVLNGNIKFHDFTTIPSATGVKITISDEQIGFTKDALTFSSFQIRDSEQGKLDIDGKITLSEFTPEKLALNIRSGNFLVFDVPRKKDQLYYGLLRTNGIIKVNGFATLPEIDASLTVENGSDFAVVVPQEELSTDIGQEVVTFRDSTELHPILTRGKTVAGNKFKGVDLDARLRIDEKARFRLLIDPTTGDSLSVSGSSTLAFTMDPSGDITLTGIYTLKDGSYFTSLQDFLQKRFLIKEGSTIRWNGAPLDAELDIDAYYKIKTSPADLITGQISGLNESEQSRYKQRLEFNVNMMLKGNLLQPEITFEIELAEKDRGAMGGLVDSRLQQVNSDPSELNKQVFALLILNRFVQQDPLTTASGSSGAEGIARSSVSRFLSDQLNQLAGNYVMGAELTFDVDSYEDFSQGQPQGRTEVGIGVKKAFMDDRFSVSVGGGVDVEGEAAKANQLSDVAGDVEVEYKLTEDGRLRASGFRKTEYQDAIEGQVTETGVGVLYMRDFNRWKNFFRKSERERNRTSNAQ